MQTAAHPVPRSTMMPMDNVPRYTSYPTAPHFHPGIDAVTVRGWLDEVKPDEELSLYVHVPFCDRLCWFCACHTKQSRHYAPVAKYLRSLHAEIETVGRLLDGKGRVRAVHLGGGSPTMLTPDDLLALGTKIRERFDIRSDASVSVEIDPNDMDGSRLDALVAFGMTRASLGVQDFDLRVQKAINREQSFAQTQSVVDGVRARGVKSVNLDLLYGLPHQTLASVRSTVAQALTLLPDRMALFGYAHVPWFKKHQTMIDEAWLPGSDARLAQAQLAADLIGQAGYETIGLDHFARPDDALAVAARDHTLRRNFQGYTEDRCETLLGFGPSSISRFREGYAQNIVATGAYETSVDKDELAAARGIALSPDDRARGWIIESLMCRFAFSGIELAEHFGAAAGQLLDEAKTIAANGSGHLVMQDDATFVVPQQARPFVRVVAAQFDRYLQRGNARHSAAV